MIVDGRFVDGYSIYRGYSEDDLDEPQILYANIGMEECMEYHEEAIDQALEENPDLMIFPVTLEAAGQEALESKERGGSE